MGAIGEPKREIFIPVIEPAVTEPDPKPVTAPEPVERPAPVPVGA